MTEKIIHPGFYRDPYSKRIVHIFCKITYDNGRLSITGVEGPLKNGDCIGGAGQINGNFHHLNQLRNDARTHNPIKAEDITFAPGWNAKLWYMFLLAWDMYHLNDMQSCCQHQRKLGWNTERIVKHKPSTAYEKFDGEHYSWNLKIWARAPLGYMCEPCPVCGYKCGTQWLYKRVPMGVISFLNRLPDTDKTPAWV